MSSDSERNEMQLAQSGPSRAEGAEIRLAQSGPFREEGIGGRLARSGPFRDVAIEGRSHYPPLLVERGVSGVLPFEIKELDTDVS
jgi:hypothetical protein